MQQLYANRTEGAAALFVLLRQQLGKQVGVHTFKVLECRRLCMLSNTSLPLLNA